jgi:transcriptional regulator with PAS, ATPase and Fis domain
VVARLVHQCSDRANKPFVAINCAAIPENLIESELFGYQKGAFSGALANKTGLVAQANGGTLFLDEVGDMPAAMQAKLLRVLETRSYRPLGAEQEYHSDFRLIAATHQPLTRHVEEGQFRADLSPPLSVPAADRPLREHMDDVPLLCQHFMAQFAAQDGKTLVGLQRKFLKQLQTYDFPGNVRELRNLLEVACAHTRHGEEVGLEALPPELRERVCVELPGTMDDYNHIRDLRRAMQQYEASVIEARLRHFQGNPDAGGREPQHSQAHPGSQVPETGGELMTSSACYRCCWPPVRPRSRWTWRAGRPAGRNPRRWYGSPATTPSAMGRSVPPRGPPQVGGLAGHLAQEQARTPASALLLQSDAGGGSEP